MLAVETNGIWATPIDIGNSGSGALLTGVSCNDATDCTAVGQGAASRPFYVTEAAGSWGSPQDIAIPGSTGGAWSVSCPSASNCTAVGGDYESNKAFYSIETSGTWANPVEVTSTGSTGIFYGVSCPDASYCTAVGYDEGTNEPFYDVLSIAAPLVPPPPTTTILTTTTEVATTTTPSTTTTTPSTTTTTPSAPPSKNPSLKLTVRFPTGSAVLSQSSQAAIKRFVNRVISERGSLIGVSGFASPRGPRKENASLILERAEVVSRYVHKVLNLEGSVTIAVRIRRGGIKHLSSQFDDQVATLYE
jgi:hypothetical protein